MGEKDILLLTARDVISILEGREREVMRAVRNAYDIHAHQESSLPHSVFLTLPNDPRNRTIALPAYLGRDVEKVGIKWIASFPGNLDAGLDRASAVIILNSAKTGRPEVILEGATISATRTAASAALAAEWLHGREPDGPIGMIGCGLINYEIARFLSVIFPRRKELLLYDSDPGRAAAFTARYRQGLGGEAAIAHAAGTVLRRCELSSIATSAVTPHIPDLAGSPRSSTILHISLRDLSPEAILAADNVVDDIDHVCRSRTSVHLAEQKAGNRKFIRCTLADVMNGSATPRTSRKAPLVFSPFGLGVLDISVAGIVTDLGRQQGRGTVIPGFLPDPFATNSATSSGWTL